ncbi:uncharacterized protein LOC119699177 isoform X2 [Motacilla alba alba]|uniref:uncharacterized protein LOC119699177 isoform X2 n=1 Tax=Motacilla alba alba TaxID=1094192 RepID=UPI0018D55EA5|nr:uncharacterized protein LOC119699177 isoform X2 [Motacilla alba alba]
MEGTGPGWLVPSSHKDHKMLPALTSDASKEFCNNRRRNKASQSSSFTDRNNRERNLDTNFITSQRCRQCYAALKRTSSCGGKSAFRTGPAVTGCGMAGRSPGNSGGAAAGDAGRSRYPAIQPARLTTSTRWRLPIRSRRGCHATYLGGRLAQPAVTGAMPKRKLPVPLRARGALRAGSGRAALPPRRRRRRRRLCSALRPAAGSVHCSSAGPRPDSGGSGSQRRHPDRAPLNTAGQLSPRRKQHGGAARPAFHRPGAAAGALKTKRRTATFHTVPFLPRAE